MDIKTILDLQASYDELKNEVTGIFLKLNYPGNVSMRSSDDLVDSIYKQINKLQKEKSAFSELLIAAEQLSHLHACEQEGIASGQPTPEQWYQAANNLNEAIEKVKQENPLS